MLQIFSSSTYAPEGSDPSSYKEFILIYTMWYVHVKFFYQSPLYRSISEASLLSASEWSAKYGQFLSPANKALASGSLLLIVRVLLDSLSTILKRLASGSENSNLYAQIKSLSRTIQVSLRRVSFILLSILAEPFGNNFKRQLARVFQLSSRHISNAKRRFRGHRGL